MGAQVAELVAVRLGVHVQALILLTPVPLRGTQLPDEDMQSFHALGGNPQAQRELRFRFSVRLDDVRLEKLGRLGDRVKADSVGVFADIWNHGHPLGAQKTRYQGPVLIVRGDADAFVTAELIASAVAPHFGNPTVAPVGNAGHWPHVEQPESVAAILETFLATSERTVNATIKRQR
jgi:pimeloyl-ACP methyl ester carboxylesterase